MRKENRRKWYRIGYERGIWLCLICIMAGIVHFGFMRQTVQAKTVSAKLSAKTVKVGRQIKVLTKTKKVTFRSSNTKIASIDVNGVITGKRAGKVTISIKRKGYKKKKCSVTVKKNRYKPSALPVTFSEILLKDEKMVKDSEENVVYSARIKNKSSKGKIKKIIYHYEIQHKERTPGVVSGGAVIERPKLDFRIRRVKLKAVNIAAGKTSPTVRCEGDYTGFLSQMKLVKIDLYTGDAKYRYNARKGTYSFMWGTPDKKAPKIKGLVKKKSYTGNKDIYRVYYSDKQKQYNFKKFVTATDDRDGKVKIKADTSKINWKKTGVYKLWFIAKDKAGNVAKSWAKVKVITPGTAESIADEVLRSITRKKWSDTKKARAIYRYIRGEFSYTAHSNHMDWRNAAIRGIRYRSGDCYTYYAAARLLLTRAGIFNVMIKRYPTKIGRHFWNLAYVRNGWYHFDTTPRTRGGKFCLLTDAQLWHYSSGATFRFNRKLYPKRAVRKISATP